MLTHEPTAQEIREWKRIFEESRGALVPNRRSGVQVDAYLRAHYPCVPVPSPEMEAVIRENVLENGHDREKLPEGGVPDIRTYRLGEILIGMDLTTGFFQVESEDPAASARVYDDLFVYRGLDAADLENFFLVAQYVTLSNHGRNAK
ncbi:MAG: hypothetical protein IJ055_01685 [Oscillospiraceae bacterium]|nr:hypothetical protein [Oscillospiraceae bacterium]